MWTNENAKQRGAGGRYFWTNTATPKQFLSMNAKWTARQKKKEMFTLLLSNCFAEPRRDQNVISRKHGMLGGEVSRRPQIQKGDNEKKKKKFSGRTLEVAHHRAYVHDLYCLCVVICIKGQFFTTYLYGLSIKLLLLHLLMPQRFLFI